MTVGQKKAPTTLVDDCIEKFRQHEVDRKRQRLLSGQRASADGSPVEFTVGGEGDPLSAVLNESLEDMESLQAELPDARGEGPPEHSVSISFSFKLFLDEGRYYR